MPLNEGQTVQYTVVTTRVADGTVLYWKTTGNTTNSDIVGGNTGSITITNNQATFNVSLINDVLTDGTKELSISISTGSQSGPTVVSTANPITINDTSLSPVYKLFTNGWNSSGELGLNDTAAKSNPTQVGSGTTWLNISAGYGHSVAVKDDGTLWAWGDGYLGALGLNDSGIPKSSPTQVGALTNWLKVSASYNFTLAIKADGTLWGWGNNTQSQLGDGTSTSRSSPVQIGSDTNWKLIATGKQHSIGTTSDYLYGWGNNFNGQVGDNSRTTRNTPTIHNNPFQAGTYNNGTGWQSISAGSSHSAGVFISGGGTQRSLYVWGGSFAGDSAGVLGTSNRVARSTPIQVGNPGNDWYTTLSIVACGGYQTAITTTDGKLWTWGSNSYGALGQNNNISYRSSPTQVGTGTTWLNVAACSSYNISSMMATKTDGTLWTWGLNNTGNLGLNDTVTRSSPTQVGTATNWNKISMGRRHFMVTTSS
jgi:alpha-tubulin suppressor-like RCC1 family protein